MQMLLFIVALLFQVVAIIHIGNKDTVIIGKSGHAYLNEKKYSTSISFS
jgi:hypothetical protein